MTVVLQGLSLPLVIRLLRLSREDTSYCEEGEARRLMLQAALDFLNERRNSTQDESETHLYDDLLHQFEHRSTEVDLYGPAGSASNESADSLTMGQVLLETIRAEREKLNSLRQSGRVGDSVHRSLERELDLTESRLA